MKQDLKKGTTFLSQKQYVTQLLKRFSMEGCNPVSTLMSPNSRLVRADSPLEGQSDKKLVREYQQLVGALLYLSAWTRPEISFVVNQCAKFMSNPGPTHMVAAKCILLYLKGHPDLGLTYSHQRQGLENVVWGFADADHAGDPDTRRSVTGYVLMVG